MLERVKMYFIFCFLIFVEVTATTITNTTSDNQFTNDVTHRNAFSIFHIVQFENVDCVSESEFSTRQSLRRNGTCFNAEECSRKGGQASGPCASGFGICCLFLASNSGSEISQNSTYVRNPDFPGNYNGIGSVGYKLIKPAAQICWIRLDFETFSIAGPSSTDETATSGGSCNTDSFEVSTTSGQLVPKICGLNSGEHIYIDIGNTASDSATMTFTFESSTGQTRSWEIKVSQIECYNENRPPAGCLQYWPTLTGRITTFNFWAPSATSTHLANQDVTVCIRRNRGYCCIQYQVCNDVPLAFSLDTAFHETDTRADIDTLCTLDYVAVPGSSIVCAAMSTTLSSKFCSPFLNPTRAKAQRHAPLCDCTPPFEVYFHTNSIGDTGIASTTVTVSRGVCLDFMQVPCIV